MVVGGAGGGSAAVAGRDEQVAGGVDGRTGRRPDAAFTRGRRLVGEEGAGAVLLRPDHPAVVLAAIAGQPAVRDVNVPSPEGEGAPLLVHARVRPRRVDVPAHAHGAGARVDADQLVDRAGRARLLGHHEQLSGAQVDHGCAGHAERIDVAARERRLVDRGRHVSAPQEVAVLGGERVDRVVLRDDEDARAHDQRLGVHGAVEGGRGPEPSGRGQGRLGRVVAGPVAVQVVGRPRDGAGCAGEGRHQPDGQRGDSQSSHGPGSSAVPAREHPGETDIFHSRRVGPCPAGSFLNRP